MDEIATKYKPACKSYSLVNMFIELKDNYSEEVIVVNGENIISFTPRINNPSEAEELFYIDFRFKYPIRNPENEYAYEHSLGYKTKEERDKKYSKVKELLSVSNLTLVEEYLDIYFDRKGKN